MSWVHMCHYHTSFLQNLRDTNSDLRSFEPKYLGTSYLLGYIFFLKITNCDIQPEIEGFGSQPFLFKWEKFLDCCFSHLFPVLHLSLAHCPPLDGNQWSLNGPLPPLMETTGHWVAHCPPWWKPVVTEGPTVPLMEASGHWMAHWSRHTLTALSVLGLTWCSCSSARS